MVLMANWSTSEKGMMALELSVSEQIIARVYRIARKGGCCL